MEGHGGKRHLFPIQALIENAAVERVAETCPEGHRYDCVGYLMEGMTFYSVSMAYICTLWPRVTLRAHFGDPQALRDRLLSITAVIRPCRSQLSSTALEEGYAV